MRHIEIIILFVFLMLGINSCEKSDQGDNTYSDLNEIDIPTDSPRGLAFDGNYLWYSDDSLNCLYKISNTGSILRTVKINKCKVTGFDFYESCIWCINDTTVLNDTTISHYPFSCIYKLTLTGEKMDSILIEGSVNPQRPEFIGMTVCGSKIYGSTNQGWSSCLYEINLTSKEKIFLQYHNLTGLTTKNDTIYGIDRSYINKNRIAPFDSDHQIIEDKVIEISFQATDLVFINNDLWVCDREAKKLKRIK
jgi:hypothetical protein